MNVRHQLAAIAIALAAALPAHALDLTVELLDARSDQGFVAAALYASAESWMKQPLKGGRAAATAGKVVLVFRDLAPGRYALAAQHDENGNGRLDSNVVGIPTERYGFSRDTRRPMGPPTFDDAAVDLQADTTIIITLR